MPQSFVGPGTPLTPAGLEQAADLLAVRSAEIWTVLRVETSGCGYLADRRPRILFERHYFSRLTQGAHDATHPDISNPAWGGYGAGDGHQYQRLDQAIALNEQAALKSASWGIGQVMGENHQKVGFSDVAAMVRAMVASEDAQLAATGAFIRSRGIATALKSHDWESFARVYNGPGYAANDYPGKLGREYARLSAGPLPDLTARTAQVYLMYLGYDPGPKDGMPGRRTYDALNRFQTDRGLPVARNIDGSTVAALAADFNTI